MTYVEGASLHQERAGATVFARYAFDELWSFIAGWAVLLDFLILIAVTAFVATNYVAAFWSPLGQRRARARARARDHRLRRVSQHPRLRRPRDRARRRARDRRPRAAAADHRDRRAARRRRRRADGHDRARHLAALGGPAVRADDLDGRLHRPGVRRRAGRRGRRQPPPAAAADRERDGLGARDLRRDLARRGRRAARHAGRLAADGRRARRARAGARRVVRSRRGWRTRCATSSPRWRR